MADVLFVTWDGGGNVPPAVAIADELRRRGHRTRFLGHASQAGALTAGGHGFRPYRAAKPFVGAEPASLPRLVTLFSDRGMGRDLLAAVDDRPADLVVVDALLLGALDAAARHGLRYATLQHLFDGYQRGGWLNGPVGRWAKVRRLRPVERWEAAELAISATLADLDPGAARPAANLRFTGPALRPPRRASSYDRTVLVSLSTFHYPGMRRLLQRLIDATADLDARVVVTTGPVIDPSEIKAHGRTDVHRFVPHDDLMPQSSLVVGHGGHGTAMRALAHGVPLLVVPMHPLLDHPMVGRAVETAGAGRCLRKGASHDQLRSTIAQLVEEGPHREAAVRLARRIQEAGGAATAADAVEELLRREPSPSTPAPA